MAYRDIIIADDPIFYWPMDEGSGSSCAATVGSTALTLTGATVNQPGQVDGTAVSFNGTNQFAQSAAALDLTPYNKIYVEIIGKYTYNATVQVFAEFGTNFNSAIDQFVSFIDSASPYHLNVSLKGNEGYNISLYPMPEQDVWKHFVFCYDKSADGNEETNIYINGVKQTPDSKQYNHDNTNNFGNEVLNLMARNGAEYWNAGTLQHVAIYNNLSDANILAHAIAAGLASAGLAEDILISPENEAIDQFLNLDLTWEEVIGTIRYICQIAYDSEFSNILYSITAPDINGITILNLSPSTTYYWKVKADDSEWSETFSFTTRASRRKRVMIG